MKPFSVRRAFLRHGRSYAQAVKTFYPYEKAQKPNPEARAAIRALIERARAEKQPAFVFVNNRLEGNAPETIQALVELRCRIVADALRRRSQQRATIPGSSSVHVAGSGTA